MLYLTKLIMKIIPVNQLPQKLRERYEQQFPQRRQLEIDDMIFEVVSCNFKKATISLKLVAVMVPDRETIISKSV